MKCPICGGPLKYIGHALFRCQSCNSIFHIGIERIRIFNRALTAEDIRRISELDIPFDGVDDKPTQFTFPSDEIRQFLPHDKWVWTAWCWSQYGENIMIASVNEGFDLLKRRCPKCGSRNVTILGEEDVVMIICKNCGERTACGR